MAIAKLDPSRFGPWAVVTGASSGIGEEIARQIAANGIHVVLVARRLERLEALGRELEKSHSIQLRAVRADLSEESAMESVADASEGLDVGLVVSNAGTATPGEFLKLSFPEVKKLFR